MLEVRRLRLLVELQDRGTIAAVAQALHLSPSGVSQQLGQLERELRVPILERVGRGVRLTRAGRRLAERSRPLLDAIEFATVEARSRQQPMSGTVRLAAFQSAAMVLVPPALVRLAAHPGLRAQLVQVEPEIAVAQLVAGEHDIVIAPEYAGVTIEQADGLDRTVLFSERLDVVFAPALVTGGALGEHGADLPWVMGSRGSASRAWAEAFCDDRGFRPRVQYESDDLTVQRELIARGHAIGILPQVMLAALPSRLVRRPTGQSRTLVTLARPAGSGHPAVTVVQQALAEAGRQVHSAF